MSDIKDKVLQHLATDPKLRRFSDLWTVVGDGTPASGQNSRQLDRALQSLRKAGKIELKNRSFWYLANETQS